MLPRSRYALLALGAIAVAAALIPAGIGIYRDSRQAPIVVTLPAGGAVTPLPYASAAAPAPPPSAPSAASDRPRRTSRPRTTTRYATTPTPVTSGGPVQKFKRPGDGTVDINTAAAPQLQQLPGVGPAMAARILAARALLHRFRRPNDLLNVRGIGPKKYARMAPFVRVS